MSIFNDEGAPKSSTLFDVLSGRESVKTELEVVITWRTVIMIVVIIIAIGATSAAWRKLFQ